MDVRRQIFRCGEQPQELLPAHARSGFTGPIPWGDPLIPGALVQGPDRLFDLHLADYQEPPLLHISAAWRTDTRLQDLSDQIIRHRVWLQPPHRACGADNLEQVAGSGGCGHPESR